ncbi:MAG: Dipeptidyl aminopeptidase BIII [Candidatus Anoxychlamydiales bacterium]|nr:Dipeptidyl aminopeptidase BIII [Candidatus Anoxychlamydiales bacterium]
MVNRCLYLIIIIISVFFIQNSFANENRLIPVEDFFRNPEKTNVKISPSGNYIAYLASWNNRLNIFIQNLGTNEVQQITEVSKQVINSCFWIADDKIIYLQDQDGDEKFHIYLCDIKEKTVSDLTPYKGITCKIKNDASDITGSFLFLMNKRNKKLFDIYRLDLITNKTELVAKNPGNIIDYLMDNDGKIRICIASDGLNNEILYRDSEEESFRVIKSFGFKEFVNLLCFTSDNKNIYVNSNINTDTQSFCELNLKTGAETCIFSHPIVDIETVLKSKKRNKIIAVRYILDKTEYKFFDEVQEKTQKFIDKNLPEYENFIVSNDKEEKKFIIHSTNDKTLGSYYILDIEKWNLTKLFDVSPWLKESELYSMKPISYKARDGLTIYGYLTMPNNKTNKKVPLIVYPHGGPWRRTYRNFRSDVQFFANRGYAVLQMNFRGSIGYGKKFNQSGFKQWGLKMQDDITDGVLWAIDQEIVDPKRIAIFGGSYGGYAALCGIVKTPDLYAAAVDFVGISDLLSHLKEGSKAGPRTRALLYEKIGDPKIDEKRLIETSPLYNVDKIKTPLFIAHGARDPRVDKSQADKIIKSLQDRNIPFEYMIKEDEGHGFIKEENRLDFFRAVENFLQKHLTEKN